jgi:hypothetical protein
LSTYIAPKTPTNPIPEHKLFEAACGSVDVPEIFFLDHDRLDPAVRTLCDSCPIKRECLEMGLDEPYGIWGGTTPHMREQLRGATFHVRHSKKSRKK